jgi:hypothetical protein
MSNGKRPKSQGRKNRGLLFFLPFYFLLFPGMSVTAQSPSTDPLSEGSSFVCPSELNALVDLLLRDLPSYTNRVIQRSRYIGNTEPLSYVLFSSRPEFEALPLAPGRQSYQGSTSDIEQTGEPVDSETQQVFFTTLERTYNTGEPVKLQHYHWLFLTKTTQGWWMVMMFSRFGSYPAGQQPTPPRDSSNGAVAEAVRLWLRDCRAGTVRPAN